MEGSGRPGEQNVDFAWPNPARSPSEESGATCTVHKAVVNGIYLRTVFPNLCSITIFLLSLSQDMQVLESSLG